MKMETLQQRRDELERKEQQLKESLLKFDKFLKVRKNKAYQPIHVPYPFQQQLYSVVYFNSFIIFYRRMI